MPLDQNITRWIGRDLFVLPYYGYGWSRQDLPEPSPNQIDSLGPEPFRLRVNKIISEGRYTVGISGTINEPEHQFHSRWCACLLRNTDNSNFTDKAGQYMIWIAEQELLIEPAPYPQKALYQWVVFDKSRFALCGYGTVAESVDWIRDVYNRTMDTRKRVAEGK